MFIVSRFVSLPRKIQVILGVIALVFAVVVTAGIAAAFSGPSVHKAASAPTRSSTPLSDSPTPTPTPTADLTGAVGTTFTVTAADGTSYEVTLDKVIQHARLSQYDTLGNYADHAAAAEFTITGDTGQSSDDVNNDANVIGSDEIQYSYTPLTGLPNFSYGEFKVAPGQTVKGWVTFELPPGTTIDQVQWAPSFDGPAATWTVSS